MARCHCITRCDLDPYHVPCKPESSGKTWTLVVRMRRHHPQRQVRVKYESSRSACVGGGEAHLQHTRQTGSHVVVGTDIAIPCTAVCIVKVITTVVFPLADLTWNEANGTVSVRVVLAHHMDTLRAALNDIQLVGDLRIGLL